jgi:hypothetical protein
VIFRVALIWLSALLPLGLDLEKETEPPFFNRLGVGKIYFGEGVQKL